MFGLSVSRRSVCLLLSSAPNRIYPRSGTQKRGIFQDMLAAGKDQPDKCAPLRRAIADVGQPIRAYAPFFAIRRPLLVLGPRSCCRARSATPECCRNDRRAVRHLLNARSRTPGFLSFFGVIGADIAFDLGVPTGKGSWSSSRHSESLSCTFGSEIDHPSANRSKRARSCRCTASNGSGIECNRPSTVRVCA